MSGWRPRPPPAVRLRSLLSAPPASAERGAPESPQEGRGHLKSSRSPNQADLHHLTSQDAPPVTKTVPRVVGWFVCSTWAAGERRADGEERQV